MFVCLFLPSVHNGEMEFELGGSWAFQGIYAYGILTVISVVTQSLPTLVSHVLHAPRVGPRTPSLLEVFEDLTLLTSRGAHVSQKVLTLIFKLQ